jgi:hypothetical protein
MDPRINAEISALRRSELAAARRPGETRRAHHLPKFATIFRSGTRRRAEDL